MASRAGPRAQMWCHFWLTHWMCSGYRFDLFAGVRVESLCTCKCHRAGEGGIHGTSHGICMADDPERFEQARLMSWQLHDLEGSADNDQPE